MSKNIANGKKLKDNGAEIAICTDHPENPIQYLPVMAGLAMRGGLTEKEALEAMTINPARFCGIEDRVGSIEVGKDADLVMFRNKFHDITAAPEAVMIDGVIID